MPNSILHMKTLPQFAGLAFDENLRKHPWLRRVCGVSSSSITRPSMATGYSVAAKSRDIVSLLSALFM